MPNMNLWVSFKDDSHEINMNDFGHWGHGPIWNKCIAVQDCGVNYGQ